MSDASERGRSHRRKGAAAELAVARYLRDQGYSHCRRNVDRRKDAGDLLATGDAMLEIKNCQRYDLSGWLNQARQGCAEAGLRYPIVIAKPVGITDVGKWYAITDVDTLIALLCEALA